MENLRQSCPHMFVKIMEYLRCDRDSLLQLREVSHAWNTAIVDVLRRNGETIVDPCHLQLIAPGSRASSAYEELSRTLSIIEPERKGGNPDDGDHCQDTCEHVVRGDMSALVHDNKGKLRRLKYRDTAHVEMRTAEDRAEVVQLTDFAAHDQGNGQSQHEFPKLASMWITVESPESLLKPWLINTANAAPSLRFFKLKYDEFGDGSSWGNMAEVKRLLSTKTLGRIQELCIPCQYEGTAEFFQDFNFPAVKALTLELPLEALVMQNWQGLDNWLKSGLPNLRSMRCKFRRWTSEYEIENMQGPTASPLQNLVEFAVKFDSRMPDPKHLLNHYLRTVALQCTGIKTFSIEWYSFETLMSNMNADRLYDGVVFANAERLRFTGFLDCVPDEEWSHWASVINSMFPRLNEIVLDGRGILFEPGLGHLLANVAGVRLLEIRKAQFDLCLLSQLRDSIFATGLEHLVLKHVSGTDRMISDVDHLEKVLRAFPNLGRITISYKFLYIDGTRDRIDDFESIQAAVDRVGERFPAVKLEVV